jgi:hypothetical protein
MENVKHWSDLPPYSRVTIQEKYGVLTDEDWQIVVEEIDDEIATDDSDEPLFLDEQIDYFITHLDEVKSDRQTWQQLSSK